MTRYHCCCPLTLVLGLFRTLGGFPYRWKSCSSSSVTPSSPSSCPTASLEISSSSVAILWTVLVVAGMIGSALTTLTNHYSVFIHSENTKQIMESILNTYWYFLVIVLYLYIAINSRTIASILRNFSTIGVDLRKNLFFSVDDFPFLVCIIGSLTGSLGSLSHFAFQDLNNGGVYVKVARISQLIADRLVDLTIMTMLTQIYLLIKIIGEEMEITVKSLRASTSVTSWSTQTSVNSDLGSNNSSRRYSSTLRASKDVAKTPMSAKVTLQSNPKTHADATEPTEKIFEVTNMTNGGISNKANKNSGIIPGDTLNNPREDPQRRSFNKIFGLINDLEKSLTNGLCSSKNADIDPLLVAPEVSQKADKKATNLKPPSHRLLALDGLTQKVVGYAGPPIALLLLNSMTGITGFLYNAITTKKSVYYMLYLAVLLTRMAQIVLLPDPLVKKREFCRRLVCCMMVDGDYESSLKEVEKVERVISTGVEFSVCRLFTLDRQTFLTVLSFVVTYLVITLQFTGSETPPGCEQTNYTVNSTIM